MDFMTSARSIKTTHLNFNNQDQSSFDGIMDTMDFSMFPQDHQLLVNPYQPSSDEAYVKNLTAQENNNIIDAPYSHNNAYLNSMMANEQVINLFQKNSINPNTDSEYNSDDLIFSQQSLLQNDKSNQLTGLFNNDIYFVNGLLTPPDSENRDVYSLSSRNSSFQAIDDTLNQQVLSFNSEFDSIPITEENEPDYFGNVYADTIKPQLSSPLHSPGSVFEVHTPTTKPHSAKRKRLASASVILKSNNGVTKPNNKRSKTLSDLKIPTPTNTTPSPIDYNPAVANIHQWIRVDTITDERYKHVLELAGQRKLDKKKVAKVLDSFRQKHIMTKLNIINEKIGINSKTNLAGKEEKLPRLNLKENADGFEIVCHTSSGYDASVKEDETVLSGLRHLNILKDHINYKTYDELASSLQAMFKASNSKDEKVKRPLNQFMLYRTAMVRAANIFKIVEMVKENKSTELMKMYDELKKNPESKLLDEIVDAQPKLDHHMTAHVIALLWTTESQAVKDQFAQFAKIEKEVHLKVFPNYKFNPQKRNSTSK